MKMENVQVTFCQQDNYFDTKSICLKLAFIMVENQYEIDSIFRKQIIAQIFKITAIVMILHILMRIALVLHFLRPAKSSARFA